MFDVSPEILLENAPVPIPSVVLVVSAIVGIALALQQTPLAIIEAPPSLEIFPPEEADCE